MRALVMALLFASAGIALAEEGERFYQVIGPDGRLQTVRAPGASVKPQAAESKSEPVAVPAAGKKTADLPKADLPNEVGQQQGTELKSAPYGGEAYLDSDRLEQSGFNPESRRKFFITSDGMRQRVEENLMPATADSSPEAPLTAAPAELRRNHTELPVGFREVSPASIPVFSGLCVETAGVGVLADEASRLREDKRSVYFGRGEPVIAAYRIRGEGLRTVQLRSYTDSIKSPAFFSPYIGLADDSGCVVRVLDGYFQRNYAVTKTQYEMLEAEITLHAEERYLLVLRAAPPEASLRPDLAYAQSPFGQISLKFLK